MEEARNETNNPQRPAGTGEPGAVVAALNQREARRRAGRKAFLVLGVIAVLLVGGYEGWRFWRRGKVTTDDAQVDADVVPIGVRVAGTVLAVRVSDNQPVKKGDILVEIDPADFAVRVRQAKAELDAATAQLAAAGAQRRVVQSTSAGGLSTAKAALTGTGAAVRAAQAQVAAAEAALARTRSDLHKAESDLTRATQLRAKEAISEQQGETAQAAADAARAAAAAAEAQVAAAREQQRLAQTRVAEAAGRVEQTGAVDDQVAAAQAATEQAQARLAAAAAALEQAELMLSYTTVRAPADGAVSRLAVHAGQTVTAGQMLVALVPAGTYVVANFKETDIGRIHAGQSADVTIDAYPDRVFHGTVDSLSAATGARFSLVPPDNASGNFVKVVQRVPVKISWNQLPADLALRAGLSAEVTVHAD
jgi:membrane fusion protein, multidrug efflux system